LYNILFIANYALWRHSQLYTLHSHTSVIVYVNSIKGEFKAKKIMASNEHLSLIKLHILHKSDNLC